jgi:hypothetical protein
MRFIGESIMLTLFLLIMLPLAVGLTCGLLSAWAAGRKHRRRKIWFLIGFFFPLVGLVTALVIPSTREPHGLKIKRHRRAIEADIKSGGEGFRRRSANLLNRVREMDEAAYRIQRRIQEIEKRLKESDPRATARRRRRPALRLHRMQDVSGNGELEALEEEMLTRKRLLEKADGLRRQLESTALVMEKMSHRIRRLSLDAGEGTPTDEELQEVMDEISVEMDALEEAHEKTR